MTKWLASIIGMALCAVSWAGGKLDSKYAFEIPAQDVSSALLTLSEQANLQVMTASADLADVKSPGVTGERTVREALDALLKGTGLKFQVVAENAVAIGPVDEGPNRVKTEDGSSMVRMVQ